MKTWAEPRQLALLEDPLEIRFIDHHQAHPDIYWGLVGLAKQWKSAGHSRCSIDMLAHRLRWDRGTTGDQDGTFKIDNSHLSRYARLIAANEPDLAGLFIFRQLHTDFEKETA